MAVLEPGVSEAHRVLIVDDDPAFVATARLVLESHGFRVECASDGEEGLEKMQARQPDLVLLDVMMDSPLEGVEVTQQMLARDDLQGVRIVMVTCILGTEYGDLLSIGEHPHIDGWLSKPCSPTELVHEVQRVLGR